MVAVLGRFPKHLRSIDLSLLVIGFHAKRTPHQVSQTETNANQLKTKRKSLHRLRRGVPILTDCGTTITRSDTAKPRFHPKVRAEYLRSEEHTSELQSPYVISYAVF